MITELLEKIRTELEIVRKLDLSGHVIVCKWSLAEQICSEGEFIGRPVCELIETYAYATGKAIQYTRYDQRNILLQD